LPDRLPRTDDGFGAMLGDLSALAANFASFLERMVWEPLAATRWGSWHDFWLRYVLFDRYLVAFFFPLLPVLLVIPRRHLRTGITATSLAFLAYVFGLLYPAIWLAQCVAFYRLTERFAREARRQDVWRWGPPIAAIACMGGWYVGSMALSRIGLSRQFNAWLVENLPVILPLGARHWPWETIWFWQPGQRIPSLPALLFSVPQTNGIVIFTIRMMHYFSELKRGTIPAEQRSLWNFVAFCSFAPTILQGPIERFADFQRELQSCHLHRSAREIAYAFGRILLGLGKHLFALRILGPPLSAWILGRGYYQHPERIDSYFDLLWPIHLQVFYLYLDFSGYCDIAIGMARLLGYRPAENFNRYWLATSLTDMWRRWHITFSFILRDYVFMPLVRHRWPATLALQATFIVCGLMHNLAYTYVLWGMVMGLMVAINQKWTRAMRTLDRQPAARLSRLRRFLQRFAPLPRLCAWFLTLNAFACSALILVHTRELSGWRVLRELIWRPLAAIANLLAADFSP